MEVMDGGHMLDIITQVLIVLIIVAMRLKIFNVGSLTHQVVYDKASSTGVCFIPRLL